MTDIAALSAPRIEAFAPAPFDAGRFPATGEPFSRSDVANKAQVRKERRRIIIVMHARSHGWGAESPLLAKISLAAIRPRTGPHLPRMGAEHLPQLSSRLRPAVGDVCAD